MKKFLLILGVVLIFAPAALMKATAPDQTSAVAGKRVLTLADYPSWKRITSTVMSDDGKWVSYTYSPNEGEDALTIKQFDGAASYTINAGSAGGGGRGGGRGGGGGGGAVQFSPDSKYAAYFVSPSAAGGRRGGGGAGRTGGAPGGGAQAPGAPGGGAAAGAQARRLEIMNLADGSKYAVPNASGVQFSKDSQWLAVKMNGTPGDTSRRGTDLILRKLADGTNVNIGNVYQYDFDDAGKLLAYSVDAAGKMGNGVYLTTLATGEIRVLDTATTEYDALTWRADSKDLMVLRGEKPAGKALKANTLVVWKDVAGAKTEWDLSKDSSAPAGFVLSEFTAPRWSQDGSKIFIGIREQQDASPTAGPAGGGGQAGPGPGGAGGGGGAAAGGAASDQANLDIWHWKDAELQSEQMLRIAQARRATFASVFHVASKKFVRLADDTIPTVSPTVDDQFAIGADANPYKLDFSEGQPSRADYYAINTATGARTLLAKRLFRTFGSSPDSQWFLYLDAGHVVAHNLVTGRNVTVDAATKSFLNTDDDHAAEKSIWGLAGWSKDGKSVLLYDKYDLWSLPLDGTKGTMLTAGAGVNEQVVLRLAGTLNRTEPESSDLYDPLTPADDAFQGPGRGGGAGNAAVDLSKPLALTAYGEWTKKSGYWQIPAGGGQPTRLIWADKSIGGAVKSKNGDRVLFAGQTFEEFPDYWMTNAAFASPKKLTDANPQIAQYAWGSKKLIDYTNSKGRKLQATLALPAGYEPGRKYPMLVYIYEIMSNTHHQFSMPTYDDRPHMSTYASDGYLVLQPDIVYDIGKPGTSAVDCVTAAVKKVIELGYADPAHIGLQGHSWGGYESSFIVTQTNMFAAVVTGAPLTNLTSMYGILYKQSGAWNGGILETQQGRMGANVTPWNAPAVYERESAVFQVAKIQTPFLIMQGTADGAVDWNQGLEYYTAARKAGKNVIFLSYQNEPHHLAIKANQIDFLTRMKQYFDHYLKGGPEMEWMKNGLPQTKKGAPIR